MCLVYISFNRIYTDRLILFKYSISVVENIRKLELRNNTWAQFMGESFDIDSSATIPILLLKSYLDINVDILEVLKK